MSLHPKTEKLVDDFAAALKVKLELAQEKYGYTDNWSYDDWEKNCRWQLNVHMAKGDPLDVAAYAAFCWYHSWKTYKGIGDGF